MLVLIPIASVSAAVGLALFMVVISHPPRRLRALSDRRRAARIAAGAEGRARALMSELCPHGWQAQITLFASAGRNAALTADEGRRGSVALDWAELSADPHGRPAVMRRVWADSIADAMDAMVADRRTDEALEQIERLAAAEGALWPDLESGSA